MSHRWQSLLPRLLLVAGFGITSSACHETATSGPGAVARIAVTPAQLALAEGETRAVTARALDERGNPVARSLFWSSSTPSIVTVSQGGIVTSLAPGTAHIAVSAGGTSTLVPVVVAAREPSLIQVTPTTSTILVGTSTSLTARVLDAAGAEVGGTAVAWSSEHPAVATVGPTGVVTGVAAGNATITAQATTPSSRSISGTAVVQVQRAPVASLVLSPASLSLLVGQSGQFVAQPLAADGAALTGRDVSWIGSDPSIASVTSTGLVIAFAPGEVTITAEVEGRTASSRVVVSLVPVASVTIIPDNPTIAVQQTATLTARVADSTGAPLGGRTVRWSSDAPTVASVAAGGLVTAIAAGQARIAAAADGVIGATLVTVTPVPVASIVVTPDSATMPEGDTLRLAATTLDAQGRVLSGRVVSWLSGAPSIASVGGTGVVTAVGPGSALIIASSDGVRATIPIVVSPATVSSVQTAPSSATLYEGTTRQLSATILDSRGRPMAGKVATWRSSNASVATVSASGLVQAVSPGTAAITATSDGISGTTAVTVTMVPIARLALAPASAALTTGRTAQFIAVLFDSSGAGLDPSRRSVTWSSSDPSIATVGTTGVVTATSAGIATISATAEGRSGTATVIVSDAPVAVVNVAPSTGQLVVGSSAQFLATALDAGGNVITGRPVTWNSSDPVIATVSAAGLVSGLSAGTLQLTATIGGVSGAASVTVSNAPVASVQVSPTSASLVVGATAQLVATARDSAGNSLLGRTTQWSSANPSVATVSGTGLVTGVGTGTVVVTATVDGVTASASLTVVEIPIASITISPVGPSVSAGFTTTLSATVTDANGNVLTGRALTWSTSDATIATVAQTGVVAGVSAGTATISVSGASIGQAIPVSASVSVIVTAPSVQGPVRIAIAPLTGSIHVGTSYARLVSATVFDAAGNAMPNEVITWRTSDSTRLSASPVASTSSATITALGPPATGLRLIATVGANLSIADTVLVTTDLVPIARVVATPASLTLQRKDTHALAAVALDSAGAPIGTANGDPLGGRTAVWTSMDTKVVTVDSAGVATGGPQRGTTRIEVFIDGVGPGVVVITVP